jgi:DNA adenine methylase
MTQIPKPILKWVGGKTQIIDTIISNFPTMMNDYHEIFLGGGSVLFALLSSIKNGSIQVKGTIYAFDLNEPLVYIYKNIQSSHNELYDTIQTLIDDFQNCGQGHLNRNPQSLEEAKLCKENYYYWIRNRYNQLSDEQKKGLLGSSMIIFLNKTCFRGLYRVGPRGFNVPYGNYKNPQIISKEHLDQIHDLIQGVVFECCDFTISLCKLKKDDFVYLDPPYAPETDTSFVQYTDKGFTLKQHEDLFARLHQFEKKKIKFMMSNSDVILVNKNFNKKKYNICTIVCKRTINSKNPESTVNEVLIKNF